MESIKGRILEIIDGDSAFIYDNFSFYKIDLRNRHKELLSRLPASGIKVFLGKFRIMSRLLRIEPRCSVCVSSNLYFISILHNVYLLDIEAKAISKVYEGRDGFSDCLNFCSYNGHVLWGDYGSNITHETVNIYRYDRNGIVDVVYTFPPGDVMHIHNIFLDERQRFFWILAGDNESKAGIYRASLDWKVVKPFKTGEQRYRAVVGFPYKGGLIYATDSVETSNYLRVIDADGVENVICPINGSCIYGCEIRDFFLFSTTVEPHEGISKLRFLDNRLGGGIKNREVHILAVRKKDLSVKVITKLKKDWWPMVLFQYGRVRFAGGQEKVVDGFWCSPVACKGVDGQSVFIKVEHE